MKTSDTQLQKAEAYLNRIRIERSRRPSMTSREFYQQMERSMGTKLKRITPTTSEVSRVKQGV